MESLSRVEKYGIRTSVKNKNKNKRFSLWIWATALLLLSIWLIFRYVRVPQEPDAKLMLESTLFFFSGLFLVIYLASFMAGLGQSAKPFKK